MYHYNYMKSLLERMIAVIDFPLQVEFHPGKNCGPFRCPYCYGREEHDVEGDLSMNDIKRVLIDLSDKKPFIALSGLITDPQTSPIFDDMINTISNMGFKYGISTKGYALSNRAINIISRPGHYGSFISFSIDSCNDDMYCKMHGLNTTISPFYTNVKDKIKILRGFCLTRGSDVEVKVIYLLFKNNSKFEYIEKFVDDFSTIVDEIRFSIPQYPNRAYPKNFLSEDKANELVKDISSFGFPGNVVVQNFVKSYRDTSFKKCFTQIFNMTIDRAGNVFPCPHISTKEYKHLIQGNVKNMGILEIFKSYKRRNMYNMDIDSKMVCRVCDRKDETINIEMSKIFG